VILVAKILFVKYPESNWDRLFDILQRYGYILRVVTNKQDGVEDLLRFTFDLVVTDQPAVLIKAKERGGDCVPAIVLSNYFRVLRHPKHPKLRAMLQQLWGVSDFRIFPERFHKTKVAAAISEMLMS
jgi:hypothetical protein